MSRTVSDTTMAPLIVTPEEWTKARKDLLAKEKELTRLHDELSMQRRELPWVAVTKDYVFNGPNDEKQTLSELFDGKSQLIVYHLMLGPNDDAACSVCSFFADSFNGIDVHLAHRDTAFVCISRAPHENIQAYKDRMGWSFKWVSAGPENDFPFDMRTSFTDEQVGTKATYNYGEFKPAGTEYPGVSVFAKDAQGNVFHTYSCYARGLDILVSTYQWLDLTPKGRDEDGLPFPAAWVRRRDEYEDSPSTNLPPIG